MLRTILGWSLQAPYLVIILAVGMMFFGAREIRDMPVDTLPEYSEPSVEIQTEALGLSAYEVEQLITVPLEADLLNGVPWMREIRSESIPGLSSVVIVFEPGTDLMRARQMVQERLTQAHALPNVSTPPVMLQPLSSTNRVMMVGLTSDELSLIDLSVLARWTIQPRLLGVPGVANVSIWGQREQQLQVQVDPELLRANDISLTQVIGTTANALFVSPLSFVAASTPGTGGWIDTPNQRLAIRHILPITTPLSLAQVPIEGSEEILLADIATLTEDHPLLIGDTSVDDGPGVMLVIEKFPGANTLEINQALEEAFETLEPGLTGVEVDTTVYQPATSIETSIDTLTLAVMISLVLVILVLGGLFFEWRSLLISIAAIVVSVTTALVVLSLSDATFNVMTFAGLVMAVGITVDNAVIDLENMLRRLRQAHSAGDQSTTGFTIREASLEMRGAGAYGVIIILLTLLPLLALNGLSGSLYSPMAFAYAVAIVTSMLVALTLTPALSVILLPSAPLERRESVIVRWLQRDYARLLSRIVTRRIWEYATIATASVVLLASVLLIPFFNEPSALPSLKEGELLIHWDAAPGTSRVEMNRITADVSRELRSISGVQNVGVHIGRALLSDQVVDVNSGEFWVSIDSDADYDATEAAVQDVVDAYPGFDHILVNYAEDRMRTELKGLASDVVVRVYGENQDILNSQAEIVQQMLLNVDGIDGLELDLPVDEPTIEITVDLEAAQVHGVKPGDVRRTAATLLSGIHVGSLFEDQKVFEVVVWSTPESRHSLTNIRELQIRTPSGDSVSLEEVADVRVVANPNVIRRESVSRYVDVLVDVDGRDTNSVVSDIKLLLLNADFPLEYHAEVLSGFNEDQTTNRKILGISFAVIVGIFLLFQASFGSWRLAALAVVILPFAAAGGVFIAFVSGGEFSIGSAAGLIVILGLASQSTVVLINRYQYLELHEFQAFSPELVMRGAQERVGVLLATALATALAILPLLLFDNTFGHEIVYPMGIVILGGLVTTTLVTLFITPSLYWRFVPHPPNAESSDSSSYLRQPQAGSETGGD